MRTHLLIPILLLALASTLSAHAPASGLHALLESQLATFPARTGLYVKHLGTGEEAGVRADESFNSARRSDSAMSALLDEARESSPRAAVT